MGDAEKGKALFTKMCLQCHTIAPGGKTKRGPNLHKIYGKKCECATAKTEEARNFTWTDANLDQFLENPKKFMPGTTMLFAGLKKPEDRKNVIAYLKTI